jgi:hypothetical protein
MLKYFFVTSFSFQFSHIHSIHEKIDLKILTDFSPHVFEKAIFCMSSLYM